ncbi:Acriflavine resistance protein A precursor [Serratia proteamaculans]|jgi:multidrug efflux system membrane fusion protein|uniref:Efflux RND transporter periplasmic adaptor subunit n=1 Tax=Serratia proteamaculans TaxID=28151 RepID=A0ABS0TY35_SERPR|nr:efflux RND transporter periplasmic adaptor subunit [Serratia proteamaculans]SPZ53376.1 Acriflavine resistance protein A precursor [Serratia quinivorans]KAB1498074.1 efflux RND transporter periplasmic adaptor subunit [Serratia proteamaculans]MBI6182165.1 efflux RND transporter periplasmic adaptor subunit [Serratia proteamaculans]RYM50882.1 efflux transporter periplasmic adaptor subunit [Serratia proteamaculans]CAI0711702.1 Acriflavine resistance protein A precursor [Serratia proteamaculans]
MPSQLDSLFHSHRSPNGIGFSLRLSAVALLTVLLAGCDNSVAQNAAPPPPAVSTADVVIKPISQWDAFNGRIEAVQSVQLRPRVSGYIDKVNYTEGDEVKKGQVLFTIDDRTYRAAREQAQAELVRARNQAALARSESGRTEKLIGSQAISTEVWEQRRSSAAQAQSNVLAAQAQFDLAQLNLDFTRVIAPIDGRASRAMITAGNLVTTGDSASVLTTLVSLDKVYVYFDVDEATFLRYQNDGRRTAKLPVKVGLVGEDGYPHQGTVDFTDNQLNAGTGTIRMRALLENADRRFTPGLFARVQMPGSAVFNAMLINDKSVLTDQDRKFVYIVDKDGKAQRRDIEVGRVADGLRIVQKGLAAGDRVIVDGMQKVFMPGMPVNAKTVANTASALN